MAGRDRVFLHAALVASAMDCGITLLPMLIGVLMKRVALSKGGGAVAEAMGGRRVDIDTADFLEKRLLNVVEEVSIASGVRVPEVWVLDEEEGINAFAAGLDPSAAVVAVSRGCLRILSRDELQGVVGHECSHILNGDMRLNFQMMCWISGILVLSVIGRVLIRLGPHLRGSVNNGNSGSRKNNQGDSLPLLCFVGGLGLLIIGSVGAFFARWIQAAISRQREFLADASAVQFTRNTDGICGALKKIGGYPNGSRLESARSAEVAHMVFCESSFSLFAGLFSTHPPLAERIRRLDPNWQGEMVGEMVGEVEAADAIEEPASQLDRPPPSTAIQEAAELLSALPREWVAQARAPASAGRVILGLLEAVEDEDGGSANGLASCSVAQRMVLLELALSAARQLPKGRVAALLNDCERQVLADGRLNLFEMMQMLAVRRHLGVAVGLRAPVSAAYSEGTSVRESFQVILSAVAALSGSDTPAQDDAFLLGWKSLSLGEASRLSVDVIPVLTIQSALSECEKAVVSLRGRLLQACFLVAGQDGDVSELEVAFIRAVGDAIGLPVPPSMGTAA